MLGIFILKMLGYYLSTKKDLYDLFTGAVGKDFLTQIFTSENSSLNNLDLR